MQLCSLILILIELYWILSTLTLLPRPVHFSPLTTTLSHLSSTKCCLQIINSSICIMEDQHISENTRFFFLGLDTFGHNIIVSSYTQSPANIVTFFTFLAENSSHVVDTTYFSSPLSSLVGHQHLALTQILLRVLQSTLMCKSLIHSLTGYVIVMVFLFKETPYEGWRDCSVVKSTDCSSRGPEFNSQPLYGGLQSSIMGSDSLFWCV